MRWMETIHVRTVDIPRDKIVKELIGQTASLLDRKEPAAMRIFLHADVDTDLCIHLYWTGKKLSLQGSSIAQRLVAGLRMVCQVKHAVWTEVPATLTSE
jgi:hypothetical protein